MSISNYQPPVDQLLTYGDCRNHREWANYVQELKLEAQHIPELIRMATDEDLSVADSDSLEVWSPVHAWRALAQLRAVKAFESLLGLLANRDDDWISSDFPMISTLMGLEIVPLLKDYLADTSNNLYARTDAAHSLVAISEKYPETRESNLAAMTTELAKYRQNDPVFNALLICELVDLQATEAVDTIQQAYEANAVDVFVTGYWEDIQVDLGLKTRAEVPQRQFSEQQMLASLFATPRKTKSHKGFGTATQGNKKNKKSRKSLGKKQQR